MLIKGHNSSINTITKSKTTTNILYNIISNIIVSFLYKKSHTPPQVLINKLTQILTQTHILILIHNIVIKRTNIIKTTTTIKRILNNIISTTISIISTVLIKSKNYIITSITNILSIQECHYYYYINNNSSNDSNNIHNNTNNNINEAIYDVNK